MNMSRFWGISASILFYFFVLSLSGGELRSAETENEKNRKIVAMMPTQFMEIQFPELTPEEWQNFEKMRQELEELDYTSAFPKLRGFLIMSPRKWLPSDGDSVPEMCTSACEKLIAELPTDGIRKWREFTNEIVSLALKSEKISENALKQLLRENPYSAYEAEILELLALRAWRAGKLVQARTLWEREIAVVRKTEKMSENMPKLEQKTAILTEIPSQNKQEKRLSAVRKLLKQEKTEEDSNSDLEEHKTILTWTATMTEVRTPEGTTVFEDFLPPEQRGTLFADRKRNEMAENRMVPEFLTFSPDGNFLVARLGTQVTRWLPEEIDTRPQAYLVVLDTTRDGLLVWLATPETVQHALVGNPLADENQVYIPTVKLGKQAEFALDTYSLADGTLLRRDELFTVSWENMRIGEDTETIHLPIRWAEPGKILIGSPDSGVEIPWETE